MSLQGVMVELAGGPFHFQDHFYLWEEELPFKEGERLVLTKKNISLETYLF